MESVLLLLLLLWLLMLVNVAQKVIEYWTSSNFILPGSVYEEYLNIQSWPHIKKVNADHVINGCYF